MDSGSWSCSWSRILCWYQPNLAALHPFAGWWLSFWWGPSRIYDCWSSPTKFLDVWVSPRSNPQPGGVYCTVNWYGLAYLFPSFYSRLPRWWNSNHRCLNIIRTVRLHDHEGTVPVFFKNSIILIWVKSIFCLLRTVSTFCPIDPWLTCTFYMCESHTHSVNESFIFQSTNYTPVIMFLYLMEK